MKVEKFSHNNFPILLETLLLSDEEFLVLMKQKYGTSNRLNLITEMVIQQEVIESHSKLEVGSIPKVGERKPEDKNIKKTMLPKEQELGQERILQENTHS